MGSFFTSTCYLKMVVGKFFLPGSRGPGFTSYVMSPEERDMVVPRIAAFLKKVKWFGLFFPRTYVVEVIEKD